MMISHCLGSNIPTDPSIHVRAQEKTADDVAIHEKNDENCHLFPESLSHPRSLRANHEHEPTAGHQHLALDQHHAPSGTKLRRRLEDRYQGRSRLYG
jgi:hypothetical protein